MTVKELKQGEYFLLKEVNGTPKDNQVWIRGEYDKSSKTYSCTNFDDTNKERFFKGDKKIITDFIF